MLKLSAKFGSISDMLYVVMFYYKTHRIRKALHVLEITKTKLVRPFVMYNRQVDREMYTDALGGTFWSAKRREAVACDIQLNNTVIYIDELVPVQQFARQNGDLEVEVLVFVFLHFLEFLFHRHMDTALSIAALEDLEVLVQYGQEPYLLEKNRNISLQILGICQRMTGNLQDTRIPIVIQMLPTTYNNHILLEHEIRNGCKQP